MIERGTGSKIERPAHTFAFGARSRRQGRRTDCRKEGEEEEEERSGALVPPQGNVLVSDPGRAHLGLGRMRAPELPANVDCVCVCVCGGWDGWVRIRKGVEMRQQNSHGVARRKYKQNKTRAGSLVAIAAAAAAAAAALDLTFFWVRSFFATLPSGGVVAFLFSSF